jgi:hypothetical protein
MPSQETPSFLLSAAWDPRYIASERLQQKTRFPNNFSIVIEVCSPRRCIQMVSAGTRLMSSCLAVARVLLTCLPAVTKKRMFLFAWHGNSNTRYNIFHFSDVVPFRLSNYQNKRCRNNIGMWIWRRGLEFRILDKLKTKSPYKC